MGEPTSTSAHAPLPDRTVLVVEDDLDARDNLKQLLLEQGFTVHTATDGREALARLHAGPVPDVVLLDLILPVLNGRELHRRMLADPDLASLPVVVLSAVDDLDASDGTLEGVGFLRKPVEPEELFAVLDRFLARKSPQILVVEDEPAVLRMLEVVLRHHGYTALPASGGQEGIELYRKHHSEIDTVLLDVQMPGMDGPQTFLALREIDPGVRCVFMSGHTGKYTSEELLALGASGVLPKPFSHLEDLLRILREGAADQRGPSRRPR